MAPNEIAERRLFYQQMIATALQSPAELVAWFGAMQAQEYALSKWSLGLRLRHLTEASVEKSFADGHLLRIHLLRPTWHFVAAQDIRWLLRLTAPRVHAANAFMYRKLGLDAALFRRCNGLLADMLRGGRYLTRNAVNEVFRKHGIEAEGNRLAYIMMQAELDGLICSGPRKGKQFTYALLDERVPAGQDLGRDEAMSKLALRYFSSRAGNDKGLFRLVGPHHSRLQDGGEPGWRCIVAGKNSWGSIFFPCSPPSNAGAGTRSTPLTRV